MITREPHKLFAAFWIAWVAYSLVVLFTGSVVLWWIWLVSFLAVELPASFIDTGKRDTLSECMTWLQRKLSKHVIFARGWNACMLLTVNVLAMTGSMPVWLGYRKMMFAAQGPVILVLLVIWLYDHWTDPVTHG